MEFPFGHHSHHHHRRNDEEDNFRRGEYPPPDFAPPPPYPSHNEFAPPPPQPPPFRPYYQDSDEYAAPPPPPPPTTATHVYHTSHHQQPGFPYNYGQPDQYAPPPPTEVTHVSHVSHEPAETHHSYRPHVPSFIHQHTHQSGFPEFSNKPTYKVYSKADPNFLLTIREGKVVLVASDPYDEFQHWYKDEKYSTRVKDEEGYPAFALVNKATGQALKHSIGATHPVQLIPYNPNVLDESVLWTQSKDFGEGYRAIRMVNNVHLNVDAYHGDEKSGGVHDGTNIVLWKWNKGKNQLWKIMPH